MYKIIHIFFSSKFPRNYIYYNLHTFHLHRFYLRDQYTSVRVIKSYSNFTKRRFLVFRPQIGTVHGSAITVKYNNFYINTAMTKHTKYHITTRIYRPHLSKYVFVIIIQVAESKTHLFSFINKSQWFRTYIYRKIK